MKLKPLFKWTGGKNRMRDKYDGLFLPTRKFSRFIDCFYGAGAVSHWVLDEFPDTEFIINDFNTEMIELYRVLAKQPDDFIDKTVKLEEKFLTIDGTQPRKDFYNELKMAHINDYEQQGELITAVNLHFMMKINFNGWWKIYNYSNGRYATPPGVVDKKKAFIDIENLRNTSEFLREQCIILNGDFEVVRPYVNKDSFVYFDPPYRDSTTEYTDDGFDESDQIRLCNFFKECVNEHGAICSLSNKEIGDGFFEEHLDQYNLHKMGVKYTAGRGTTTNDVQEILVTSYESMKRCSLESFFEE